MSKKNAPQESQEVAAPASNLTREDIQLLAVCIAKANGHPDADSYSNLVVEAFEKSKEKQEEQASE